MKKTFRRAGRVAAVGVAAALVGGGLMAAPAFASDVPTKDAPVAGDEFDALAQQLLSSDKNIVSVTQNGSGVVVATTDGELSAEAQQIVGQYTNIDAQKREPLQAQATSDLVGGAGYAIDGSFVCSVGFSAWTPSGDPAVITAGHCGTVGQTAERTKPSADNAGIGQPPSETGGAVASIWDDLGTFAFSQYGGPGDGTSGDPDDTDIAAIDVTNSSLNLLPRVTNWETGTDDLAASSTPVTAVGTVAVGDSIERSGRSTGRQSGTVEEIGWANVCEDVGDEDTCHSVYGFVTTAYSEGGDSGGSFVRGTTAVGVLSGGNGEISFATDLENGLAQTPGYTIMLDLAEPAVTSPASGSTVAPGATITGTGPAGLTLTGFGSDITIDGSGNWTATAPTTEGDHDFTLQVKDAGFNKSDTVSYSITVEEAAVTAPAITSPAAGSEVTGPQVTIAGSGAVGAAIELSGDVTGTTTVAADGTWSVIVDAPYGDVSVIATQTLEDDVQTTETSFTVVEAALAAPVIISPANGSELTVSPTAVLGTGIPGASVNVSIGTGSAGDSYEPVIVDADGNWTVAIPNVLAAGTYTVSATQTVEDIAETSANFGTQATSPAASVTFTVLPATTPVPTPPPSEGPGGELPATGADGGAMLGTAAVGGVLVLLAGSVLLLARMRRNTAAE